MAKTKESKSQPFQFKAQWCECEPPTMRNSIFVDNGKCYCGIFKHHYHCPKCGKITQVG